ncbi:heavy metal translocating P-type ATPase [Paracoccus saliphilus]|uniref:P-type Zn(2+) transporter n=1 Tax=Paracoccus saliphilus TaxID=405559 RepID=A0AA45W3E8_9RHOB|nr:heavy metal translocating P-type ATPase [Paracoccus saliphilus]WCR02405.1 heavy metal translocating P-type ATPase [Paracoccus saliphilus]SIS75286.1 Cd2+/Zn2+-exporting ATPase [Paracoccus saliphilus]
MENDDTTLEEWRVTGMDCGSCATKLRGAVERLPGISEVDVALMAERLRLRRDGSRISRGEVEKAVRGVGFGLSPKDGPATESPVRGFVLPADAYSDNADIPPQKETRQQEDPAWYQTRKGRMLIGTGLLLAAAWVVELSTGGPAAQWAFILATLIGLAPVAKKALILARARMPFTIEMLMSIAALGALVIGAAGEAALVVFLFAMGEMLEGLAAGKARDGIRALAELVPKSARLVVGSRIREVPAATLSIGQVVQVRPGDRVPADGTVISGTSGVDESPVTGESIPRLKEAGAEVFAGSVNTEAELRLSVTRAAEDNTIARIIRLVEEAETARAPTERFIDRFSRWYMPAVVGMAVLVAVLPPLFADANWETWIYRALALLLIGCPCALVISVPASIASALSAGARQGLLMKGGAVIEAAARTDLVAFDKTGTLTEGRPQVTDTVAVSGTVEELLRIAAAVETGASHPLGQAILARAEGIGVDWPEGAEAGAIPGQGAFATIEGVRWTVGAPRLAIEAGILTGELAEQAEALEAEGKTVVAVFASDRLLGLLALRDEPREDAAQTVANLGGMGVSAVMLTGDNARTGAAIAKQIGLDYRAELLPEDKVAALRELTGRHRVMMIGDGINDAPALATAHVGIAMGSGTDVALETADGALLRNRLMDVVAQLRLARATMVNIRQNVAIALGLKGVFLITTVLGITGLWIAILADTGATVLVTLNALRLLGFGPKQRPRAPKGPLRAAPAE